MISSAIWLLVFVGGALWLAYQRASLAVATIAYAIALWAYTWFGDAGLAWLMPLWVLLAIMVLFNIDGLRLRFISRPFLRTYRRMLPALSTTEAEALAAGSVW